MPLITRGSSFHELIALLCARRDLCTLRYTGGYTSKSLAIPLSLFVVPKKPGCLHVGHPRRLGWGPLGPHAQDIRIFHVATY